MENQNTEAHDLILQARDALRRGDRETAHKLGEQAALLSPDSEDAWLVLTATDPNPEDALAYAQQALEIDPSSARALKAVEWAIARLKQAQAAPGASEAVAAAPAVPVQAAVEQKKPQAAKKSDNRPLIYAAVFLAVLLCIVVIYAAYTGVTHPALASILNSVSTVPTHESLGAPMDLAKPSVTAMPDQAMVQQADETATSGPTEEPATVLPTDTAVPVSTETPAPPPTDLPALTTPQAAVEPSLFGTTEVPGEAATVPPQVTETPGALSIEIIADTPVSQYAPPASSSAQLPAVASSGSGVRWIDVDLTNQRVYAYEGDTIVNSFIVSTGTWRTPTVTGQYKIYVKYRSAPMSGPGYYLPNVPYIMYFYKGYGLHGTYWHNNFGTPMSHGCVNLRTDEAGWLYGWASVGTLVNVHY